MEPIENNGRNGKPWMDISSLTNFFGNGSTAAQDSSKPRKVQDSHIVTLYSSLYL